MKATGRAKLLIICFVGLSVLVNLLLLLLLLLKNCDNFGKMHVVIYKKGRHLLNNVTMTEQVDFKRGLKHPILF